MSHPVPDLPDLSADDLTLAARPLEEAWTLPPAAYTSEAVYVLETDRVLRRSWMPLARVDQVPNPGDYLCLTVIDQPVMIVHGKDGEIRVMSGVCLHRAAPIAEGAGNRQLFTCPYHAWAYDTAGQLVRAPLMEGAKDFAEKDCRLPRLRTEIWEGFILVNLDDEAPAFAPQVEGYRKAFENYRLADMVVARTLEFDSPWNWKVLVENFMEAYHHIGPHSETLEPLFHARDSRIPDADGPYSILHMPAAAPHGEEEGGLPMIEGLDDAQKEDLYATVLFPHFMLAFQGNAAIWYQVLPERSDRFMLKIHFCVPKSSTGLPGFERIADDTAALLTVIHTEDIGANDIVWEGLKAPLTGQGRLSLLERSIWQMNQWWLARMAGDGAP